MGGHLSCLGRMTMRSLEWSGPLLYATPNSSLALGHGRSSRQVPDTWSTNRLPVTRQPARPSVRTFATPPLSSSQLPDTHPEVTAALAHDFPGTFFARLGLLPPDEACTVAVEFTGLVACTPEGAVRVVVPYEALPTAARGPTPRQHARKFVTFYAALCLPGAIESVTASHGTVWADEGHKGRAVVRWVRQGAPIWRDFVVEAACHPPLRTHWVLYSSMRCATGGQRGPAGMGAAGGCSRVVTGGWKSAWEVTSAARKAFGGPFGANGSGWQGRPSPQQSWGSGRGSFTRSPRRSSLCARRPRSMEPPRGPAAHKIVLYFNSTERIPTNSKTDAV